MRQRYSPGNCARSSSPIQGVEQVTQDVEPFPRLERGRQGSRDNVAPWGPGRQVQVEMNRSKFRRLPPSRSPSSTGNVLVETLVAGAHAADGVDDGPCLGHLAEDAVAPALTRGSLEVRGNRLSTTLTEEPGGMGVKLVRAMAMVPRLFFAIAASAVDVGLGLFCFIPGLQPP